MLIKMSNIYLVRGLVKMYIEMLEDILVLGFVETLVLECRDIYGGSDIDVGSEVEIGNDIEF